MKKNLSYLAPYSLLFFFSFLFLPYAYLPLRAQNYNMPGGTVTTCSGNFYDTGGNGSNYGNSESITTSFCPSTAGQCVTVSFSSFNVESNYDYLYIYNGPTTGSPQIMGSPFSGTTSPGTVTSTDAGGCLTFRFTSDGTVTYSGWAATISCAVCGSPPPCTGTTPACASPPPDICMNACTLGTLSSPPACPSTTSVNNTFCLNNSGAVAENPYSALVGCQPSGNMPMPAADVWYTFVATSTMLDISITGGLSSPSVGLYQGTSCSNMIGRGCANGTMGSLTTTFQPITPGATYYLQISGGNAADQGNFTLSMTSYNDCNNCLVTSNLTATPPPVNGQYNAGQTVNFCYNVTNWSQTAVNWIHGVVLTFGTGWNVSSLTATPPASCDGQGQWAWYNSVMGSTTGLTFGPGFFYDTPAGNLGSPYPDGNPGDNYGDNCQGAVNWNFCWSITTGTCPPNSNGANLSISINTTGDYESGSWSSGGCEQDPIYNFSASLICCSPPTAVVNQNVSCFGGNNGSATATGVGVSPFTFVWSTSPAQNTATATGLAAGSYTVTVTDNNNCMGTATVTITQPAVLTATITKTNVTCNGACNGTLSASASGGTSPYTYNWSGSLGTGANKTGICAGSYTVTVTDNKGCTAASTTSVTQPAVLTVTTTPVNESCSGLCDGSATASASGGTTAYTYNWSNGMNGTTITGLCAGSFTVTVTDANGCTAMGSVTVNAGPVITAGFTYNGNQCLTGNSFNFTNTGTMGVTYSWTFTSGTPSSSTLENPSGITWSVPGTYTVTQTVSSGSCMNTSTLSIVVYPQPTVTISKTDVTCNGLCNGSLTATGSSGTSPFTYSWSGGLGTGGNKTGVCAGSYTVTVTDVNGCTGTATATITAPAVLTATVTGVDVTCNGLCNGMGTVTVGGGTPSYTYQWGATTGFQNASTATGLCAGTHSVTVTDSKGCTSTGNATITQPAAMSLTITPTNSTCGSSTGSVSVSVSGGTPSYTYSWSNGCMGSSCGSLSAGTYFVTVTDAGGCTQTGSGTVNDAGGISAAIAINQNVLCAGQCNGSATASVTGGTPPYSYVWSTGANTNQAATSHTLNSLCGGSISVTVTDASGCASSGAGVITAPAALTGLSTVVSETCAGACNGSVTISASGGVNPYTYSWPGGPIGPVTNKTNLCAGTYVVTVTDVNGCTIIVSGTVNAGATLTATVAPANAACYNVCNGSANLTVTGGLAPYTFAWSNSSNVEDPANLCDGAYSVTATDANGCTAMGNVTITEPTAVSVTVTSSPATCGQPNGSATANPSGGTGTYTYIWNDPPPVQVTQTATGLLPGPVNVTVTDANGCTGTGTVTVNSVAGGTLTVAINSNVTCNGLCNGSATATLTGGTGPFTYTWSTTPAQNTANATGLCANTYTVTVTDASSCSATSSVTITQPPALTATVSASVNLNCYNVCTGSVTVTASGGTGTYSYQWNPVVSAGASATGLCANTYSITVTDGNGCTAMTTVTLTQPAQLTVTLSGTSASCSAVCNGTTAATAAGGTPPYTYNWNGGQSGSTATGLCGGSTASVTVTDSKGCISNGTYNVTALPDIVLTTSSTDATCGQTNGTTSVSIANGTPGFSINWTGGCASTNCTNLASGTYNVTVTDSKGCSATGVATISNVGGPTVVVNAVNDVSCFGYCNGNSNITVTDGVPPYTYAWNTTPPQNGTSATGLCAGNYSVTVTDANSCISATSITVTQPNLLVLSVASLTNIACNGQCNGTISLIATGGTPAYSYNWSNGFSVSSATGLCAGNYLMTVTDSKGCSATASGSITEPPLLYVTVSSDSASCFGVCNGDATASPGGGIAPYSYQWSDGNNQVTPIAVNLCAGNYSLTITDNNGCTASGNTTVIGPQSLTASITSHGDVDCNGNANGWAQAAPSGGSPPYTYQWSNSQGGNLAINLTGGLYIVTIADNNGCSDTAKVVITEPGVINVWVIPFNASCYGVCDGMASADVTGGVSPYTYLWSTNAGFQNTMMATGLCDGTYSVTVTDDNGCSKTGSAMLTEPQQLNFNQVPVSSTCGNPNGSACVNAIGGLSPYSVTWNTSPPVTGTCISNVSAGVYNPVITDGNGCTFTAPVIINDIAGPTLDSISGTDAMCAGVANGSATAYISGGTSPFTYIWQKGSTTVSTGSTTVFSLSGGVYTFTVIDGNGCVTSGAITINEPNALVAAIISKNNAACYGNYDGDLTAGTGGGTTPYTFLWSASPPQNNSQATGLCAGTYSVLITDANGCTALLTDSISQPAQLDIAPSIDSVNCNGNSDGMINLLPTPTGGQPPYNISWLPPGSGSGPIITGLTAGNYTAIILDYNGCALTEVISVPEPAALVLATTTNDARCGNPDGSAAAFASGGTSPFTYLWVPGGYNTSIVTDLPSGTYTVSVIDYHGCSDMDTVTVNNIPGPVIDLVTTNNNLCYGELKGQATVTFIDSSQTPFTYTWAPTGPNNNTVNGLPAGPISVTVTDGNGCTDVDTTFIGQPAQIIVTPSPSQTICYGKSAVISVTVTGGVPAYTYQWDNIPASTASQTVSPVVSTVYKITVTDANSCIVTDSVLVTVLPPLVAAGYTSDICDGEDITLNATASGGNGGPYNYVWSNFQPGSQFTFNDLHADTSITVTASDGCSKDTTAVFFVDVHPLPIADFDASENSGCTPFATAFNDLSTVSQGFIASWHWDFGDGSTASIPNPSYLYINKGAYDITLIVTTDMGCKDTIVQQSLINVAPSPDAFFTPQPEITTLVNALIQFTDGSTLSQGNIVTWSWDFGEPVSDSLNFSNDTNPEHLYSDTGTYVIKLTIITDMNCTDYFIDSIRINSEYILFAPNAFTPDWDGINDYFFPTVIGLKEDKFKMFIFDRWGDLVYETEDIKKGWDGRANGGKEEAQQDVYVWLIRTVDLNSKIHEYIGHVALVK